MPEIQLPTAAKQDEILDTIKNNQKENIAEFLGTPITNESFDANTTTSFATLLQVSGAGELLELKLTLTKAIPFALRITIDGAVFYFGANSLPKNSSTLLIYVDRFVKNAAPSSGSIGLISLITGKNFSVTPSINGTTILPFKDTIKFFETLKIEAYGNVSASALKDYITYALK